MENPILIDLSIKYGLDTSEVSKIVNMIYQCNVSDLSSREAKRIANYICEMKLLSKSAEELIEELKRKGLAK